MHDSGRLRGLDRLGETCRQGDQMVAGERPVCGDMLIQRRPGTYSVASHGRFAVRVRVGMRAVQVPATRRRIATSRANRARNSRVMRQLGVDELDRGTTATASTPHARTPMPPAPMRWTMRNGPTRCGASSHVGGGKGGIFDTHGSYNFRGRDETYYGNFRSAIPDGSYSMPKERDDDIHVGLVRHADR